ncbi:MAG: hypothetical protein HFJ75_07810, partial [Eggerthellaceae bacterium]|nr:hypothetical protein [Eggerthellaceae bacterium]
MPRIDLGRVVGRDGGFGPVHANYVNNGGEPNVSVSMAGEDDAKEFSFNFENLVNDPITSSEIESVANGLDVADSSSTLTLTGLKKLWTMIKAKFAAIKHGHSGSDITDGTLSRAKIDPAFEGDIADLEAAWESVGQARRLTNIGCTQYNAWIEVTGTTGEKRMLVFNDKEISVQ